MMVLLVTMTARRTDAGEVRQKKGKIKMTENKKCELTNETKEWCGYTLHRIKALKDFGAVKAGELGGWIESEHNLSQSGNCWIYDDAIASGNATVRERARVYGHAEVCGYAAICEYAAVGGRATVREHAIVCGYATVCDDAEICNDTVVCNDATICDDAEVCGNTDYTVVQGFGRSQRVTTFYRLKDGDIGVSCGCFHGTIKQFRDKVKETHGDSKYAKEYLMLADLMELHFGEETKEENKI